MASKKAKGKRSKTRQKLRRKRRMGKLTITKLLRVFDKGQRVQINIDPSIHSGLPDARYQGLSGTVEGRQGKQTFRISLKLGKKLKTLLVNSAHLKVLKMTAKAKASGK